MMAVVLIAVSGMIVSAQQRQSRAETLMGSALHLEEVEGNYEGAIAIFKQVLADRQASRALAARAQFHIGLCYEKLGNSEAKKAYELTVRTYADQRDVAAQASARLAALTRQEQRAASIEEPLEDPEADAVEETGESTSPSAFWQLMMYDHQENAIRPVGERQTERYAPAFSPDGKRLATIHASAPGTPGTDIAVIDTSARTRPEVMAGAAPRVYNGQPVVGQFARAQVMAGAAPRGPVWSPDSRQIAYFSYRQESGGLYRKAYGTGSEELLYRFPKGISDVHLTDWSLDGRFLVFDISAVVWVLPLTGERKPIEVMREGFQVYGGHLSPDSRFLAYVSDESGRNEIHVRAFDPSSGRLSPNGGHWKISGEGGLGMVQWRADGRQLYYLAPDSGVMAVDVSLIPTFTAGAPRLLFRAPMAIPPEIYPNDDHYGRISPDGQRIAFQVLAPPEREVVAVAPEILAQYVGQYVRGNDRFAVTLEGGQLMYANLSLSWKSRFFAVSETLFIGETDSGVFEFVRGDAGDVTHLLEKEPFGLPPFVWLRTKPTTDPQITGGPRGGPFPMQLTVYDRQGKVVRALGESLPDGTVASAFSPDGTRIVTEGGGEQTRGWIFDLSTTRDTQLTVESLRRPVFSPDGRQIAYSSERQNYLGLYRKASDGTGREQLLYRFALGVGSVYDLEWSPDGRFLVIDLDGVPWVLPLTGERTPFEFVREAHKVSGVRFSPDNRLLAYVSDESGRREVYVQTFDPASGRFAPDGRRWKVSDQGGQGPLQWRRDGRELYYWAADGGVMAVDVATTPVFQAGPSNLLFRTANRFPPSLAAATEYSGYGSISPDGQRFAFRGFAPPERKTITVAPEILAQYVGTYGNVNNKIVISLESNQLMAEVPSGKYPMLAVSETYFFARYPNQDVDIEFVKDDKSRVTHMVRIGDARRIPRQ
jgi:Tol biopolymer transport system component